MGYILGVGEGGGRGGKIFLWEAGVNGLRMVFCFHGPEYRDGRLLVSAWREWSILRRFFFFLGWSFFPFSCFTTVFFIFFFIYILCTFSLQLLFISPSHLHHSPYALGPQRALALLPFFLICSLCCHIIISGLCYDKYVRPLKLPRFNEHSHMTNLCI